MSALDGLYQESLAQIKTATADQPLHATTHARLAWLVSGIMAAHSCVLARVAAHLWQQEVTGARCAEHVSRRLRRALNDPGIRIGLEAIGCWLVRRTPLRRLARLPRPHAPSWADEWRHGHYWRTQSQSVRP